MSSPNHAPSGISSPSLPVEITAMLFLSSIPTPSTTTIDATEGVSLATTVASTLVATAENDSSGECALLGEASIFIQGALGGLALLSLVFKRWRERPQRPVKVWFFDVSKQVVGSVLLHIANLLMSMLSSGQLTVTPKTDNGGYKANPCSFYLLNLAIDTTIGIPILIVLLRLLTYGFSLTPIGKPPASIQSGNYGRPPKAAWWLKQSFIYFLGLLGMKACVFVIFQLCPWIIRVGDWALKWTEGNETVQVFFVMLFFPVVMNALQYYIIDGFIKDKKSSEHEPFSDQENDNDDGRTRRPRASSDGERLYAGEDTPFAHGEITGTSAIEDKSLPPDRMAKLKIHSKNIDEYDPATDGETTPNILDDGGGSSEERDTSAAKSKNTTLKSSPHSPA